MGTRSDHFGDPGIQGVTQQALGGPGVHFYKFQDHFGRLWAPFCDLSFILGAQMGDSFQVHVFGDPGMEMMPECSCCMCYKHSKNDGFREISLFPLFH